MEITEVRVKLADERDDDRLLAYCSITFDNLLVVRDLRVVLGKENQWLVSMPSRKVSDHCPTCHTRNPLRARYCSYCGKRLGDNRGIPGEDGRVRLYADIAHPIDQGFRRKIENAVLDAVELEQSRLDSTEEAA